MDESLGYFYTAKLGLSNNKQNAVRRDKSSFGSLQKLIVFSA
jgi:hypothetical protein